MPTPWPQPCPLKTKSEPEPAGAAKQEEAHTGALVPRAPLPEAAAGPACANAASATRARERRSMGMRGATPVTPRSGSKLANTVGNPVRRGRFVSSPRGTPRPMVVGTGLLPERYQGPRLIGRGGMGEIYRATDTALGRAVAVKLLAERYAWDEAVRERFTREALAAARLSGNANIVTIFDVGEWRGRPYIVMEYLAGGSLAERLEAEGPQPPGQALQWLEQAAAALDAAHREGVVHRDVKPANLLLDRQERLHMADFGIASAAGLGSVTQTGTVPGTASYLSPEQANGQRATPASDCYSLGIVAFELFTGRRPFAGDTAAAEAAAHVTAPIPSAQELNPALPPEIDGVFARALAKDPRRRFETCGELVAALRAALDDAAGPTRVFPAPAPAAPVTAATRVVPRRRRRRAWLVPLVGGLILAALAGAVAGALLTRGGGTAAPPSVSVRTVTQPGTTVEQTVTAQPTTTAESPTTAATTDPSALNDQAYGLMQQGDYAAALPLLQQAVQDLQENPVEPTAGYANYNLGVTLMQLGRCDEAKQYLETAKKLEPGRHEVGDALKQAQHCGKK